MAMSSLLKAAISYFFSWHCRNNYLFGSRFTRENQYIIVIFENLHMYATRMIGSKRFENVQVTHSGSGAWGPSFLGTAYKR